MILFVFQPFYELVFQRQEEFSVKQQHFCLCVQASLKKFMDYIQTSAVDKMIKFIDKGLDPNFQDSDTGGKENHRAWGPFSSCCPSIHYFSVFCP